MPRDIEKDVICITFESVRKNGHIGDEIMDEIKRKGYKIIGVYDYCEENNFLVQKGETPKAFMSFGYALSKEGEKFLSENQTIL